MLQGHDEKCSKNGCRQRQRALTIEQVENCGLVDDEQ